MAERVRYTRYATREAVPVGWRSFCGLEFRSVLDYSTLIPDVYSTILPASRSATGYTASRRRYSRFRFGAAQLVSAGDFNSAVTVIVAIY